MVKMASGLETFEAESKLLAVPQASAPTAPTARSWLRGLSDGTQRAVSQLLPVISGEKPGQMPKLAASSSGKDFDEATPLNEIYSETCASDANWIESLNINDFACANVSNIDILAFMQNACENQTNLATECPAEPSALGGS